MPLNFPEAAFGKEDRSPDTRFYAKPRFVTHIDDGAIRAVTEAYRKHLPENAVILDLMSSWVSHLPPEATYAEVIGHGMNAEELAANTSLSRWFVSDLNADPTLPLEDAGVGGAAICVSIQYLQRPVDVLAEVRRVLAPNGPVVISFSNRCFPTKAVAIWQTLSGSDQSRLVSLYLREAGFTDVQAYEPLPPAGWSDPLWVVVGRG